MSRECAFFAVALAALARLDHRVKFYLWKACNEAKVHPDDLLKTRRLNRTTYAGLLDLTRRETLEAPPQELPPIQGELIDYARARTVRTPTRRVIRYFKEVVLHAEHRLFGDQANFRELQLDARFVAVYDWREKLSSAHEIRRLFCFAPPPHGEEIASKDYTGGFEGLLSSAKYCASDGGLVEHGPEHRNLLALFNFEQPHLEEIIGSKKLPGNGYISSDDEFENYVNENKINDVLDGFLFSDNNVWPVDEGNHTWDTDEYESRDLCEYGTEVMYDPLPSFREVLYVPLLLVTHYMRKQLAAVLGKQRLEIMELLIMRAVGSRERKFEYEALKQAFPVLPTPAEARQLMMSPVQLTLTQTMANMPLVVGRALFAIGVDEVFQGDKRIQDAVEAAAKVNAVPFVRENFIASGITCSEEGKVQIRDERAKHTLEVLKEMRSEEKLPSTCIPVFDFAMSLLSI